MMDPGPCSESALTVSLNQPKPLLLICPNLYMYKHDCEKSIIASPILINYALINSYVNRKPVHSCTFTGLVIDFLPCC